MSHPFTGQDSLAGFALKMSDLLWKNEVDRRDPYHLYPPSSSSSGYSLGAVQWDIPNFTPFDSTLPTADNILEDILRNARDINDQLIFDIATVDTIFGIDPISGQKTTDPTTGKNIGPVYSVGDIHALNIYIDKINQALDSTYGRQKIDSEHVTYVNAVVTWV